MLIGIFFSGCLDKTTVEILENYDLLTKRIFAYFPILIPFIFMVSYLINSNFKKAWKKAVVIFILSHFFIMFALYFYIDWNMDFLTFVKMIWTK